MNSVFYPSSLACLYLVCPFCSLGIRLSDMHTCVLVTARGRCWVHSLSLCSYSLETVSVTRPGAHHFTSRLNDQKPQGTSCLPLPSAEVIGSTHSHPLFCYMDVKDLDSYLHALTASTLSNCISDSSVAPVGYPGRKQLGKKVYSPLW